MISAQYLENYLNALDTMGAVPLLGTISAVVLRIPTGIALLICYVARENIIGRGPVSSLNVLRLGLYQFTAFGFEVFPFGGLVFHSINKNHTNNLHKNTHSVF